MVHCVGLVTKVFALCSSDDRYVPCSSDDTDTLRSSDRDMAFGFDDTDALYSSDDRYMLCSSDDTDSLCSSDRDIAFSSDDTGVLCISDDRGCSHLQWKLVVSRELAAVQICCLCVCSPVLSSC